MINRLKYVPELENLENLELPGYFYGPQLPQTQYFFTYVEVDYDQYLTKETQYSASVVNNSAAGSAATDLRFGANMNVGQSFYSSYSGDANVPAGGYLSYTNVAITDDANQSTRLAAFDHGGFPDQMVTWISLPVIQQSASGSGDATVFNVWFATTFHGATTTTIGGDIPAVDAFGGVMVQNQTSTAYKMFLDEYDFVGGQWLTQELTAQGEDWANQTTGAPYSYTAPARSFTFKLMHGNQSATQYMVNAAGNMEMEAIAVPVGGGTTLYSPAVFVHVN